jgi:hypothetical protein
MKYYYSGFVVNSILVSNRNLILTLIQIIFLVIIKSLRGTRADKLSGQTQIPVSFAEIIISERWKKSRGGVIEINKEQV